MTYLSVAAITTIVGAFLQVRPRAGLKTRPYVIIIIKRSPNPIGTRNDILLCSTALYRAKAPRKDISISATIIVPLFYSRIWDFVATDIDYLDNIYMY